MSTNESLTGQTVLVIGRAGGLAGAIAVAARDAGAQVIVAGRHTDALTTVYADDPGVRVVGVDLTDDLSIRALAEQVGEVDHVVSTASARARGTIDALQRDAIRQSFDTKVIGPLMLAQAFQGRIRGSLLLRATPAGPPTRARPDRPRPRGLPRRAQ